MRRLALALLVATLSIPPAALAELPSFQIVAHGGRLIPATLQIPAGQRVKLFFRNEGPGPEEFEITEMRIEKVLVAGAEGFAVLPPRKSGDQIKLIGEFHGATAQCIISVK